jgi:glycerate 2-kinase
VDPASRTEPHGRVVAAFDKFRGSATSRELGDAAAHAAREHAHEADVVALSDGGEGFLDVFAGDDVTFRVAGPLGDTVVARLRLHDGPDGPVGVIESADVVGRHLLVHPTPDEALAASSDGLGHLLLEGARLGARRLLVGCGGSATSDAGLGCYRVLRDAGGLPVPVTAATDVTARFFDARRYAEQKGVDPNDLRRVDERLATARALYLEEYGVDVGDVERTGAAGGIAGALFALGATLTGGFDLVAREVALASRLAGASFVVTGEGRLDAGTLEGKVVAGVADLTTSPLLVLCGSLDDASARRFASRYPAARLVSLVERFGEQRAMADAPGCVRLLVAEALDT